ncbi:MAG: efflux RND transporter periplasmic adaptor subunit [Phycisphaeraceae bacterium]|nr:efflux RND transporter periplasmic adaptor subunit [Phycisphaeraceae bacterium]
MGFRRAWNRAALALPVLVMSTVVWGLQPDDEKKSDGKPAAGGSAGGPPPARVVFDEVRLERVERWREVTGELRAVRRATVAAEVAGRVSQIDVHAGDRVETGQLLAAQDDELAKIEVARAEAILSTRKAIVLQRLADLEKADRDLLRYQTAFDRNSATELERDDARTIVAGAKARVEEARAEVLVSEAELSRATKALRDMRIVAPFAGTVVLRRTEVGQWLTVGDPVVEIVATRELDAFLDVPESVLRRLAPGALTPGVPDGSAEFVPPERIEVVVRVEALPEDLREIRASVAGIVPVGDPLSRLFPVRIRLDNTHGLLRPGMSIVGVVPTGQPEEALTVKRDAVLRSETGAFVYFEAGGVSAVAPIVSQYATRDRLVVRSPVLRPGMRVVVEGNERLFPGRPLMDIGKPNQPPAQP